MISLKKLSFLWLFSSLTLSAFGAVNTPEVESGCTTYYPYSPVEIDDLLHADSTKRMTREELKKWDQILLTLQQRELSSTEEEIERHYAHLYTAQRDAAFLSFKTHGEFVGSLDPLCAEVLALFFPSSGLLKTIEIESDSYSQQLSQLVLEHIKKRYAAEEISWKTGLLPTAFKATPPPPLNDSRWYKELRAVKRAAKKRSKEQTRELLFWSEEPGTGGAPWILLLNGYLTKEEASLQKALLVRSLLAEGLYDALISAFTSKYFYNIQRPEIKNSAISHMIRMPSTPSYPSAHSTLSGCAATLLTHYFPKEETRWWNLAEAAGYSRICAGVNFPLDHQEGLNLGVKVAEYVIDTPYAFTKDRF